MVTIKNEIGIQTDVEDIDLENDIHLDPYVYQEDDLIDFTDDEESLQESSRSEYSSSEI